MDAKKRLDRRLEKYFMLGDPDACQAAIGVKNGRRRSLTYHYKGKCLPAVTVCDSWYSKMSRLSKQLDQEGAKTMRPAWMVFLCAFPEIEYDDAMSAIESCDLTFQFQIVQPARDMRDGVDSWH